MESFCILIYLFLFIPVFVMPVSYLLWILLSMHSGRGVRNPFSIIDVLTPIICIMIWGGIDAYFVVVHKRMGNLIEIVALGGVWALLFLVRLCVLFRCLNFSKSKWRYACLTTLGVMILTVLCAFLIPSGIE